MLCLRGKRLVKLNILFINNIIIKCTIRYLTISFIAICILNINSLWAQKTYYIDSQNGNDNNDGLSKNTAWKSHTMVSTVTFQPGDTIAFKKVRSLPGQFNLLNQALNKTP